MASVRALADHVQRALSFIATARNALAEAHAQISDATHVWAAVTSGTVDPEAAQLPARAEAEGAGLAQHFATLKQAEQMLRAYLGTLGVGEPVPNSPTPALPQHPTKSERDARVEQARQRVGRATTAGGEAWGEWVRADGWSIRITSGAGDEHHDAVVRFARDSKLPPAVARLARHGEVKVAVAMREHGLRDETVVIDRQVCGTRPFDRTQPYTCDKYLSRFLPPGARLRVVQADGTVATYTGKEEGPE
jgi:nucleic acid/nucleotide deaminase of polymorphic system toxin